MQGYVMALDIDPDWSLNQVQNSLLLPVDAIGSVWVRNMVSDSKRRT
jgi:hypothetical protein